ncbi:MAG: DUF11 domain-containing protein, partial [Gammaproteobacteria bacterium]|nr:DUF11 domain-containing protein [Gammaproteobacteria bacterium]
DDAGNATTTADSSNATLDNDSPTVTDANISISGASGAGGAFKVGDTVMATWNNTAGGDNNADISGVTVDFSQFGGGAAVAAGNSGNSWSAGFAITEGGGGRIEADNLNLSVTATDNAGSATTTSDGSDASLDNSAPTISSSLRQDPVSAATIADGVTFRITFDTDVQNVGTGDFLVSGSAAGNAMIAGVASVSAGAYDVNVTGLNGSTGSINLDVDGATDIQDLVGNPLIDLVPTGADESYTIAANNILINEVDADQTGSPDNAEFIELYADSAGSTPLDGLVLVLYNGTTNQSYQAFDLGGQSTNSNGYFILCGDAANVINCDLDIAPDTDLLEDGPDAVALFVGDAADFPNGSVLTSTNLQDALVYDTDDADDPELLTLLNAGEPQINENENSNADTASNQRCPDGGGGKRNTSNYLSSTPTPGAANGCTPLVEFNAIGFTSGEGVGSSTEVTLNRAGYLGEISSVQVAITGGSAAAGSDYDDAGFPKIIRFAATENTQTVTLDIIDDPLHEPGADETISFSVDALSNADIGSQSTTTLNISDNELRPTATLSLSGSPFAENGGIAVVTVNLSHPSTEAITTSLGFSGTATGGGVDYSASDTSILIPAGGLFNSISLTGIDDAIDDDGETVVIDISSVSNGTENGNQQTSATILDDDIAGIHVTPTSGLTTTEIGGAAQFTISLNSQPTAAVAIPLNSSDVSEGQVAASAILDASNWNTGAGITVVGVNDTLSDGNIAYTVETGDPVSADPVYDVLTATDAEDVALVNLDKTIRIALSKTADLSPVRVGSILNYDIDIANIGSVDAENYVVIETLPANVSLRSTSGDCQEAGNAVPTCTLGAIPAGTTKSYSIAVDIGPAATNPLINTIDGVDLNGDTSIVSSASESTSLIQDADGDGIPDDKDNTPDIHNPNICSGDDATTGLLIVPPGADAYCYATNSISTTSATAPNAIVMNGGILSLVTNTISLKSGFEVQQGGALTSVIGNVPNYFYIPSGLSGKASEITGPIDPEPDLPLPILGSTRDAQGVPLSNHHPGISSDNRYITYIQSGANLACSLVLLDLDGGTSEHRSCPFMLTDGDVLPPEFNSTETGFEWTVIDELGVMQTYIIHY